MILNLPNQPRRLCALDSIAQRGSVQGQAFGARRVKWGAESARGLPGSLCRNSIFPSGWFGSVLQPGPPADSGTQPRTRGASASTEPLLNKDRLLTSQAARLLARQLKRSCPRRGKCRGKQLCDSEHKWEGHEAS